MRTKSLLIAAACLTAFITFHPVSTAWAQEARGGQRGDRYSGGGGDQTRPNGRYREFQRAQPAQGGQAQGGGERRREDSGQSGGAPQQNWRGNGGERRFDGNRGGDTRRFDGYRGGGPQQAWRGGDSNRRFDGNRGGTPQQAWRGGDNDRRFDTQRRFDNDRRAPQARRGGDNRRYDHDAWRRPNYPNRYNDHRRVYAAIPYGGYFGPRYSTTFSRYYGRQYIYYGARAWPSWRRPWRVGYVLPPSLYCQPLPYDLYGELEPPPYGYEYALCDGDVLLIDADSRIVMDAMLY